MHTTSWNEPKLEGERSQLASEKSSKQKHKEVITWKWHFSLWKLVLDLGWKWKSEFWKWWSFIVWAFYSNQNTNPKGKVLILLLWQCLYKPTSLQISGCVKDERWLIRTIDSKRLNLWKIRWWIRSRQNLASEWCVIGTRCYWWSRTNIEVLQRCRLQLHSSSYTDTLSTSSGSTQLTSSSSGRSIWWGLWIEWKTFNSQRR